tara:strand:+ start:321 stop:809 length:489 start_codon:yes stop_codon:yes gene_type:complete
MGTMSWTTFLERVQKDYPNAKPEKVLNMIRTAYKKGVKESQFQTIRNSWAYIVVGGIANKHGTKDINKKVPLTQTISNYVKSKQYKDDWCLFHPKKVKNKKTNRQELSNATEEDFKKIPRSKHVRNCNEIWISVKGKKVRKNLSPDNKFYIKSPLSTHLKNI